MPRKKPKKGRAETLAQQHRRLVRAAESASDDSSLQQPEPVMDAAESVRFVTIYGLHDLPV